MNHLSRTRVTCQALEMARSGPKIKVVQKFPKKCGIILDMYFRCFDHLKSTKPIFWASFRCLNIYIYFHTFFTFLSLKVHLKVCISYMYTPQRTMFAPARKIPSVGIPAVPTNSGSQTLRKRERKKH